jgi:hypothetical protein
LLLGFLANPFADGQQPNHAGDADEDTEHRQCGTHWVEQKAFNAELPSAKELHVRGGGLRPLFIEKS